MKTITEIQNQSHAEIEHIVGNLKGNVIDASKAVELLDTVLLNGLNAMRYPAEPPVHQRTQTQQDILLANHFNQSNKTKE